MRESRGAHYLRRFRIMPCKFIPVPIQFNGIERYQRAWREALSDVSSLDDVLLCAYYWIDTKEISFSLGETLIHNLFRWQVRNEGVSFNDSFLPYEVFYFAGIITRRRAGIADVIIAERDLASGLEAHKRSRRIHNCIILKHDVADEILILLACLPRKLRNKRSREHRVRWSHVAARLKTVVTYHNVRLSETFAPSLLSCVRKYPNCARTNTAKHAILDCHIRR